MMENPIIIKSYSIILLLALAGCYQSESQIPVNSDALDTKNMQQRDQREVLNSEARSIADQVFSRFFINVGDSWFTILGQEKVELIEIRGLTSEIDDVNLSAADNLNRIEWQGDVDYECKAHRRLRLDTHLLQWSEWINGSPATNAQKRLLPLISLIKKNNLWDTQNVANDRVLMFKPTENQISLISKRSASAALQSTNHKANFLQEHANDFGFYAEFAKAKCKMQIALVQKTVRVRANLDNLDIGADLKSADLFRMDLDEPKCPCGGTYTWKNRVPRIGMPYGNCDFAGKGESSTHVLGVDDTQDW